MLHTLAATVQDKSLLTAWECTAIEAYYALAIEALTYWNKSTLSETKNSYQRQPLFVSFPVTKPAVTHGATRYQMKDVEIISPLISP